MQTRHIQGTLQAVLEATGNIDLNGGSQHKTETMSDEGNNTILQTESGGEAGGKEDFFGPDGPAFVVDPPDELGRKLNPRLNLNAAGHAYLREWGLAVVDKRDKEDYEDEDNGGGEDFTSESDAAAHSTKMKQEPKTTRKTCDKGDSQDIDHALTSGQGKE